MQIDRSRIRKTLQQFNFEDLFIEELGWDNSDQPLLTIKVDQQSYTVKAIAQKRGMVAYHCITNNEQLPDHSTRRKIDKEVTQYTREHFIIYTNTAKKEQVWQWVRREPGKPQASRENRYHINQSGENIIQKLEAISIDFEEEDNLTLADVTHKARKAFDVDKVTKKFYKCFEKEHTAFLKFVVGISSQFAKEWYVSLMLNRLMFIYFIQKKGFLDQDTNYLQNRLKDCQKLQGKDEFYSFYRYFLLKLFHDGLGKQTRTPELEKLLGRVPYLNGGLFEVHHLEKTYSNIQISDEAFEKIFEFFDQYNWHLDDRPLKDDNEINPDVLGYIFEKYINQKQMGAYYTKEDITEYISKNCIIPYLFDAAARTYPDALREDSSVWQLLADNPHRYIYEAVQKGVDLPLPNEIAVGINDVSKRTHWNQPAHDTHALPTEIWREHIARRQRCLELREKLAKGEVTNINDLITYNLNIRQFAQDAIANCEDPKLIWVLYQTLEQMSVLDPTCGSGAFLFAALNILEPLYDGCLERMQSFLDDKQAGRYTSQFEKLLNQLKKHPNQRYFILKSIIINNLYGVDIMEEATEICKLRLFLKLVAQVEPHKREDNFGVEPLPDIDFNIRAGNTLVGFASLDEVRKAITQDEVKNKKQKGKSVEVEADQLKLDLQDDASRINEKAEQADRAFQQFRQLQTKFSMDAEDFRSAKKELRRRLAELNEELNHYLAREYKVDVSKPAAFQKWRDSHQPFHWFVEFYSIIDQGGFDVIIGNPPYLENTKLKSQYSISGYSTFQCGNIYTCVLEKAYELLSKIGKSGFIVPLSLVCTKRTLPLRKVINPKRTWISCFDIRPSSLFEGVAQRLSIILSENRHSSITSIGGYHRWTAEERNHLIETTAYTNINPQENIKSIAKVSTDLESRIVEKISGESLEKFVDERSKAIYIHRIVRYFIKVLYFVLLNLKEK
jgi:hypothetical protein